MNFNLLREDLADKLLRASLTNPVKILQLTENELQKACNLTRDDAKSIFFLASESIIKFSQIPKDLNYFTVGCQIIDNVLGGGLPVAGGINELSGESGCGKTQFCLQIALTVQNPISVGGIDKSVLYICTEDKFPSKRLLQLMNNIQPPFKHVTELAYGDRIYVEHIADVKRLKDCLLNRLPKLLNSNSLGLLIIDSITALFRAEYSQSDSFQRTKDLRCIGRHLHMVSKKHKVTASMKDVNASVPALGLAWANLVTSRILMRKSFYPDVRTLKLVFSPHQKPSLCNYMINECGIRGLK